MNAQSTINLRSGNKMPIIGMGTWQLTGVECMNAVRTALELGYRMIDTSSDYNNHDRVGWVINHGPLPREEIFLTTKVEEDDDAYEAVKEYLYQLGMDYADLILIHRPPADGLGIEMWKGLIEAKAEGLTKDSGISNYSIQQIEELIKSTGVIPAVNQIEWNPFGYSQEMFRYCRQRQIIIQAYSPLTRGERLYDPTIMEIAQMYDKTPAQTLIRWNIEHKVVPIVKATSRQHLQENIDVFDFELSNEVVRRLDSLNEQYSSLGRNPQYIRS